MTFEGAMTRGQARARRVLQAFLDEETPADQTEAEKGLREWLTERISARLKGER